MGGACGTYWRGKKGIHDLGGKKKMKEIEYLKTLA